jgi:uncharacterized protein (DUF2252 family)
MSADAGSGSVLETVLKFNEGRKPRLVRLKLERMAGDPFSFFRGADHLFADAWPDLRPPDVGPEIPLCGDLHLENFGAYRDDDGEYVYDINDFDEAVVAACSLDLVRCATSILLAGELWRLTPLQATRMVLTFLDEYRATVSKPRPHRDTDDGAPILGRGPVWDLLGKSALDNQVELLDEHTERLKDGTRRIRRSRNRHPAIKRDRADAVGAAVEALGASVGRPEASKVLDVTGRVAGIGSLGVRRYTVLIQGGGTPSTNRLLDVKQCLPSSLRSCSAQPWPFPDPCDAARVVRAQRMLQARPTVGLNLLDVAGTPFRLREMIPEENRTSLDRFQKKPAKLLLAIREAGLLTGLAQRRGAGALPGGSVVERLAGWAAGPALDSVLAAAVRFAERTRTAHSEFRQDLRDPGALPRDLRRLLRR